MVWWAIGIAMWLGYTVFAQWDVGEVPPSWLPQLGGGILILAGAYQFSRWKQHCADMCRSPLAFVLKHDFRRGIPPAFGAARTVITVYDLNFMYNPQFQTPGSARYYGGQIRAAVQKADHILVISERCHL
jgi:hypothetical protein